MHKSVLAQEALTFLEVQPNEWYIDATFGRGGHTRLILNQGGSVIAFDHDQTAIEYGQEEFRQVIKEKRLILVRENFNKLTTECQIQLPDTRFSGILFDFGTSVDQLKDEHRGFSFESDAELDMRMDDRLGVKAKDLLAILPEKQLEELFRNEGGEEEARAIARRIVKQRATSPITTTYELTDLIESVKQRRTGGLNMSTKVFQALRIAVNVELDNIRESLPQTLALIKAKGRIVTISFHEGEDRIVKNTFKQWETEQKGQQLTKKPVEPTLEEVQQNKRARSAKLRVFEKN